MHRRCARGRRVRRPRRPDGRRCVSPMFRMQSARRSRRSSASMRLRELTGAGSTSIAATIADRRVDGRTSASPGSARGVGRVRRRRVGYRSRAIGAAGGSGAGANVAGRTRVDRARRPLLAAGRPWMVAAPGRNTPAPGDLAAHATRTNQIGATTRKISSGFIAPTLIATNIGPAAPIVTHPATRMLRCNGRDGTTLASMKNPRTGPPRLPGRSERSDTASRSGVRPRRFRRRAPHVPRRRSDSQAPCGPPVRWKRAGAVVATMGTRSDARTRWTAPRSGPNAAPIPMPGTPSCAAATTSTTRARTRSTPTRRTTKLGRAACSISRARGGVRGTVPCASSEPVSANLRAGPVLPDTASTELYHLDRCAPSRPHLLRPTRAPVEERKRNKRHERESAERVFSS